MDWEHWRGQFPALERWVYLNYAAVAPIGGPVLAAMTAHLDELASDGARYWQRWPEQIEHTRAAAARLLGAAPSEIALLKNTSEGLAVVAAGLDWRAGDRVVSFDCEFPANLYPWLALRPQGVEVELLPEAALLDLDRVREACRGRAGSGKAARVLSVSFVQYLSGLRADCAALGEICRESGTLLVVDGIQGCGALPLEVKRAGIHACAAGSHKWLMAPEGAGFLYLDPELLEQLRPREIGWSSVEAREDYGGAVAAANSPSGLQWRPGSARFECGSLNTAGLIGLGAALDLIASAGVEAIGERVLQLNELLSSGLRQLDCKLLRPSEAIERRSGITSFRHPTIPSTELVARLETAGFLVSSRGPAGAEWVRCSPHACKTPNEVVGFCAALR